jgi:hypothetical protein
VFCEGCNMEAGAGVPDLDVAIASACDDSIRSW